MTHTNNTIAISVSCAIIHVHPVLHQTYYAVTNPVRDKFIYMNGKCRTRSAIRVSFKLFKAFKLARALSNKKCICLLYHLIEITKKYIQYFI